MKASWIYDHFGVCDCCGIPRRIDADLICNFCFLAQLDEDQYLGPEEADDVDSDDEMELD